MIHPRSKSILKNALGCSTLALSFVALLSLGAPGMPAFGMLPDDDALRSPDFLREHFCSRIEADVFVAHRARDWDAVVRLSLARVSHEGFGKNAHFMVGQALANLGKPVEALERLDDALASDGSCSIYPIPGRLTNQPEKMLDALAHSYKATLLRDLGDPGRAGHEDMIAGTLIRECLRASVRSPDELESVIKRVLAGFPLYPDALE
jgi:hypothetical protein